MTFRLCGVTLPMSRSAPHPCRFSRLLPQRGGLHYPASSPYSCHICVQCTLLMSRNASPPALPKWSKSLISLGMQIEISKIGSKLGRFSGGFGLRLYSRVSNRRRCGLVHAWRGAPTTTVLGTRSSWISRWRWGAVGTARYLYMAVQNRGCVDKLSSHAIHSSHLGNRHLVSNVLYCSLCHFVTSLLSIGIHIGIFG